MLSIKINVQTTAAKAPLAALSKALVNREGLHESIARGVDLVVLEHLTAKYVPRNKRGNFWERVVESREVTSDAKGAEIALVEPGVGLRYHGGEVTPGKNPARSGPRKGQPTKALSVPSDAVPVKSGRQLPPFQMGLLAFLRKATGGETVGFLVEGEEKLITRGANKGKTRIVPKVGGSLLYTLRTITRHPADKNILPDERKMEEAAESATFDWVDSFF